MNVLLLSMPDYFEHMPPVAVRMPNGALTSLAGNVDDHHRVAVAGLILSHRRVRETINRLFHEIDPEVVFHARPQRTCQIDDAVRSMTVRLRWCKPSTCRPKKLSTCAGKLSAG